GNGTTTSQNSYSFFDSPDNPGKYFYRLKQIDFDGTFSYSDVVSGNVNLNSFSLSQNYPNPFNPETAISFNLQEDGFASIKIFNVQGEEIEVLFDGFIPSGNQVIKWNASNFTSGVYFYKINFDGKSGLKFSAVKKMVLTK
ncbi:MAG TPA: T9SS type A sorting domain-containing protein, partial [Ignavibacteriaceae bacterium]|nr:T9SS type A sorting domain-containing protein [Ignavibacteriaceae bacterium]